MGKQTEFAAVKWAVADALNARQLLRSRLFEIGSTTYERIDERQCWVKYPTVAPMTTFAL